MTESKITQDDIIREILAIIQSNTIDNKVMSYHDIGIKLKEMGLSSKSQRKQEWDRLKKNGVQMT